MVDFKEIINAWIVSFNPTESQKAQAAERLSVCLQCENYSEIIKKKKWSAVCKECGCPIEKKIYSNAFDPCPLDKWDGVDMKYNSLSKKIEKTIL
jgi:hypothetical protein